MTKELEKAQMHLAKQQEANESTRIEFERMSAELNRYQERLERSEAEREALKSQRGSLQSHQVEKNIMKLETDAKQLALERYVLAMPAILSHFDPLCSSNSELMILRSEFSIEIFSLLFSSTEIN